MESYKCDFERLQLGLNQAVADVEATVALWKNFQRSCSQLEGWMKETEQALKTDMQPLAKLAEKKVQLEQISVSFKNFFHVRGMAPNHWPPC